jgi:bifunctional non-homologous end joining protein LigD
VCLGDGDLPVFERLRTRRHHHTVFLYAFDLIQIDGSDIRRAPIEERKAGLLSLLRGVPSGIQYNEHIEGDAAILFAHACKLGLEGIVSKRSGTPYLSGRSPHWVKLKNPHSPAVRREAEEDWGA